MAGMSKRPTLKLGTSLVWELEATGSSYAIGAGPTYRVSLDLFSGGWLVEASHWDRGERCWVDTALDTAQTRAFLVAHFRDGRLPRDLGEIDAIAARLDRARSAPWPEGLGAPAGKIAGPCPKIAGSPVTVDATKTGALFDGNE